MSKCLQVLLIGYFLLSSINISNSFRNIVSDKADVHKTENTLSLIIKKVFKCSGCTEEYDDFEAKTSGTKSLYSFDYLVPGHTWLMGSQNFTTLKSSQPIADCAINCNFYCKIHLPPPEVIA
ncbi:hypothetical protein GR160_03930 [Flavobacterium sp. Sd200]|uniref:hypothetical protein n=1 Tax=Flavobacterium sp. Sd200 TaxID=2692211 RepID=UPI00136C0A9A|nr:hypothetical protein [Flavobacterium sp. Sd200]MXN90365.1 hypothetical protein [Flavobacterium sp. Sd200]